MIKGNSIDIKDNNEAVVIYSKTQIMYEDILTDEEKIERFVHEVSEVINLNIENEIRSFGDRAVNAYSEDVTFELIKEVQVKNDEILAYFMVWNGEEEVARIQEFPLKVVSSEGEELFKGNFECEDIIESKTFKLIKLSCEYQGNERRLVDGIMSF